MGPERRHAPSASPDARHPDRNLADLRRRPHPTQARPRRSRRSM